MYRQIKYLSFITILLLNSCVENRDFAAIESACSSTLIANASFAQVKELYNGELLQIQEDLVIEGYVISSDEAGNFFSVLHFQDEAINPSEGFQIEIDLRESHLFFEPGSKIFIKLKGLFLGKSRGVFKLGGTFAGFGTTTVGRLPALQIPEHIFLSCEARTDIQPTLTTIDALQADMVNTLVRINEVEFIEEELENTFAVEREETERTLSDCLDINLVLLNSGFSDFFSETLPQGNGDITGVLLMDNDDFLLAIRIIEDINFVNDRCEDLITEFTSNNIFISELADPNNSISGRFVELYNASDEALDLNGWELRRYTNASTEVSSRIDLSGYNIASESTLVISPNAQEFEIIYGFAPDIAVSTNSPADSNGDDNLQLVDPFGEVIDTFGIIGEDGSGTNHEFEDGRAFRNLNVTTGNPNYNFLEWTIYNDTGDAETINMPQNAPEDFTPGLRE